MKAWQTYRQQPDPQNPSTTIAVPDVIRFEADAYTPAADETPLPALPAWDMNTQRLEWSGSAWVVSPLSAAAQAAKTAEVATLVTLVVDKVERQAIRGFYNALKAGTATNAQVQRVVAFLLKTL